MIPEYYFLVEVKFRPVGSVTSFYATEQHLVLAGSDYRVEKKVREFYTNKYPDRDIVTISIKHTIV